MMILTTNKHYVAARALAVRLLSGALVLALLPTPEIFAQATAAIHAPMMLHINILEGEGALNNIKERTAREPIVEVEDENHKPVAGVVVVFASIRGTNGAGGTFNSFTEFRTVTNAQGRAVGRGFQPNTTSGQFTIQVTATLGSVVAATAVIHELNTGGAAGESSSQTSAQTSTQSGTQTGAQSQTATTAGSAGAKTGILHVFHVIPKWVLVGVAAGTAAAVTVAVTQSSSGTTISTGTGSVGAPSATRPTLGK